MVDNKLCDEAFKRDKIILTDEEICAGGIANEDTCSGDSGGPLMKVLDDGENGPRYYVVGVVTAGKLACGIESPGIYLNVQRYVPWILDQIAKIQGIT